MMRTAKNCRLEAGVTVVPASCRQLFCREITMLNSNRKMKPIINALQGPDKSGIYIAPSGHVYIGDVPNPARWAGL